MQVDSSQAGIDMISRLHAERSQAMTTGWFRFNDRMHRRSMKKEMKNNANSEFSVHVVVCITTFVG